MDIETTLKQAIQTLTLLDTPRLDAEILLSHLLEKNRTYLKTWGDRKVDDTILMQYEALLARRVAGEPVAYLIEKQEFWSLPLYVNKHTLVPRPDTETLVALALKHIEQEKMATVLDLGTGSGAIALALASSAEIKVCASDNAKLALAVAQRNARALSLDNIHFVYSDWLEMIEGTFDMIVSNPPYIEAGDTHLESLRYEPYAALVSGKDGLDAIRKILATLANHLRMEGVLMFEHGYNQGKAVRALMRAEGFCTVTTAQDLGGQDRVTWGRRT